MKTWLKKYEWTSYAACADDPRHTVEASRDSVEDIVGATGVCEICLVRPECIEWALKEKACAVVVAGVYLPDPIFKKELRAAYNKLQKALPGERDKRGEV